VSVKYTILTEYFNSLHYFALLSCCRVVEEAPAGAAAGLLDGYGLPTCQVRTADTHIGF